MRTALIILLTSLSIAPTAMAQSPFNTQRFKRKSPAEIYEAGLRMMRNGYYTRALENFNRVRNYHRDDPASVRAQLAIADVHFLQKDFEQARFAYEEFATYHPRHENLDYVTYKIGLSIFRRAPGLAGRDQSSTRGAVNIWTGFDTRFPNSTYNKEVARLLAKARNRLAAKEFFVAKFYENRKAWGAVEGRTATLVKRFPHSKHVPKALALLGKARHAWGDVEGAAAARDRLAAFEDAHALLAKLDRQLQKEPGIKPKEEVFIRPYRVRGMNLAAQGGR